MSTDTPAMTDAELMDIEDLNPKPGDAWDEYDANRAFSSVGKLLAEVKRLRAHEVAEHLATEAAETENDRLREQLAEMTRCRNNAMAYAAREHVPIELDDEIDTDGETLADRIEGELLGPGWDWEDDRTPGQLARTAVAVIRPHLARLTDQAQKARAELAKLRPEYGVRVMYTSTRIREEAVSDIADDAREQAAKIAENHNVVSAVPLRRPVGDWEELGNGQR